MPPEEGSLRDRMVALLQAQGELIANTPVLLTATSWLALGPDMERFPLTADGDDSPEVRTLRSASPQYGAPFDAIFDSPDARAELGEVDRAQAIMLLIRPLVVGRISTLADFDYRECARKAVDGFLAVHRKTEGLRENQPRGWTRIAARRSDRADFGSPR
jgi:hypothetical protein